ncbi:alpha/beta fold hydrolase [Streptomyces sp. SID8366]|uniref:alpha/beta hydrolase n=1 Tax=unclassified Streptomyces TaxID=2593676 RepID=UPI000DB97D12|nr:alpha/beta fold hydrolase [Streptomyces sp. PsTaAH-130]MYU06072.1 alpha/beta fold hydrolase [Streptomyces sp. SID8366]MYU68032.1 alpha/beta fold hydrolase [Streptomyces sp. SID69]RAJ64139.1 serine aminopeptidase S33 family [Streptomyces sp. PsTaAH-130]
MTTRATIQFPSHGEQCTGWLYLPATATTATTATLPPVIVMGHGLGSVRTMRLDAYAERFAAAGYACLVFDYRHFGESEGQPRQLLDITKQREDFASALAYARSLSSVDGTRLVVWGTSFGGGHAIAVAADDGHASAVIAQCPFTSGFASGMAVPPWTSVRLTALGIVDQVRGLLGAAPLLVPTAGAPGTVALMTAPDAEDGYLNLVPADGAGGFDNRAAARISLHLMRDMPGRRAAEITAPILFAVCDADSVAPAGPTLKYARTAPAGEIKLYPEGHFEIYVGEPFERVVADQLDFLARTVPVE